MQIVRNMDAMLSVFFQFLVEIKDADFVVRN